LRTTTSTDTGSCDRRIDAHFAIRDQGRPADAWLSMSVRLAWRARLSPQIESELFLRVREQAEQEAIRVFGENLRDLLLAAPAGMRVTLGLDPGLRTGVKVVVVDATGKLLETAPSIRTRPGTSGMRPLRYSRHWRKNTACSWSVSATAPPRGRPTSWCAS
jgi:transcriptional accessory protein Tex/SPT6